MNEFYEKNMVRSTYQKMSYPNDILPYMATYYVYNKNKYFHWMNNIIGLIICNNNTYVIILYCVRAFDSVNYFLVPTS